MRLKSYFAATVEAAMNQARQEMGGDAMLVHTKRLPPEQRHTGEYEVVFALDENAPARYGAASTNTSEGPCARPPRG